MLLTQELAIKYEEESVLTEHPPETELREILYDEALKLAGNHDDAKELAEEAYKDFLDHRL